MTRTTTYGILAALALVPAVGWGQVASGQAAPDFTVKDVTGKTHKLSDYRGRIVVLEAYNYDCPFCANHYRNGAMQALQAAATSKGMVWLVVNSTHQGHLGYRIPRAAQAEFKRLDMKATAWIDDSSGALGKRYGMKTTPHMFVIDQKGLLVYQGAIDNRPAANGNPRTAKNFVRPLLESLVTDRPVSASQTKPYGCGVKYGS